MMVIIPNLPRERIEPVMRAVMERLDAYRELSLVRRKELAATAIWSTKGYTAEAVDRLLGFLDEVEANPWAHVSENAADPAWGWAFRATSLLAWIRNVADAYARLRTACTSLGRAAGVDPEAQPPLPPLPNAHLERTESLAAAILDDARQRLRDYRFVVSDDSSRRDWRNRAEDELFDMAVDLGVAHRPAAAIAVHLVAVAGPGGQESSERLTRRADSARKRGARRAKNR